MRRFTRTRTFTQPESTLTPDEVAQRVLALACNPSNDKLREALDLIGEDEAFANAVTDRACALVEETECGPVRAIYLAATEAVTPMCSRNI